METEWSKSNSLDLTTAAITVTALAEKIAEIKKIRK
jgi:hypothetical protein